MAELQLQFDATLNRLRARLRRQAEQRDQELSAIGELIDNLENVLSEGALQQAMELRDQARQRLQENISLSRKEMGALERRLHACNPRINELRGWRRWGTGQAREHLCEAAEALIGLEDDPLITMQRIKQFRANWKSLDGIEGAASKALWNRFNTACERAYEPCQSYFDDQARERQANLEKKRTLCKRLEQLDTDTDWNDVDWRAMDRTWREAQNQWRKTGPVDRSERKAVDRRFNKAVRRVDAHLDKERQRSLQQRKALIRKVQQLVQAEDLQAAVEGVKQAQTQWQPTVLASRREEQVLWKQFRAACDAVFDRRQAEQQAADAERQSHLERKIELCEAIETQLGKGDEEALAQARAKIREAEQEWESIGPVPRAKQREIDHRFDNIRNRLERSLHDREQASLRAALEHLEAKARLCVRLESLLEARQAHSNDDPTDMVNQLEQDWDALPPLKPQLETSIRRRFEATRDALSAGIEARQSRRLELEANLESKKMLCLRMEIIAGVDSPPEFAQARMEYQVSRLSESLNTRALPSPQPVLEEEARWIRQQWYLLGTLPSALNDALEARFSRAAKALHQQEAYAGST
jgi:hypothetical protein